jgi:16S rRNA (guanine966-N2)-methyltransferase
LEKTRLGEAAHVYCISVEKALTRLDKEYGIVIMDPPYPDTSIGDVVIKLAGTKRLKPGTIVVVTHSPHHPLEPTYGDLRMFKEHRHGDSVISIYHKEALT